MVDVVKTGNINELPDDFFELIESDNKEYESRRTMTPREAQIFEGKARDRGESTSVANGVFDSSKQPIPDVKSSAPLVEMTDNAKMMLRKASRFDSTYIETDAINIKPGVNMVNNPTEFAKEVYKVQINDNIIPADNNVLDNKIAFLKNDGIIEELTPEQIKAFFYLPKHNREDVIHMSDIAEDIVTDSYVNEEGKSKKMGISLREARKKLRDTMLENLNKVSMNLETLIPFFKANLKTLDETQIDAIKNLYTITGMMDKWEDDSTKTYYGIAPDVTAAAFEQIYDILSNINYDFDPEAQIALVVFEKFKTSTYEEKVTSAIDVYKVMIDLWYKGYIENLMPDQLEVSYLLEQAMNYFEANPIYEYTDSKGNKKIINMQKRIHTKQGQYVDCRPIDNIIISEKGEPQMIQVSNEILGAARDVLVEASNLSGNGSILHNPNTAKNLDSNSALENMGFVSTTPVATQPVPAKGVGIGATVAGAAPSKMPVIKVAVQKDNHTAISQTLPIAYNPNNQVASSAMAPTPVIRESGIKPINENGHIDLAGLPYLTFYENIYDYLGCERILSHDNGKFYILRGRTLNKYLEFRQRQREMHNDMVRKANPTFCRPSELLSDANQKIIKIDQVGPYFEYIRITDDVFELGFLTDQDYRRLIDLCRDSAIKGGITMSGYGIGSNVGLIDVYNRAKAAVTGRSMSGGMRIDTPINPANGAPAVYTPNSLGGHTMTAVNNVPGVSVAPMTPANPYNYTPIANDMTVAGVARAATTAPAVPTNGMYDGKVYNPNTNMWEWAAPQVQATQPQYGYTPIAQNNMYVQPAATYNTQNSDFMNGYNQAKKECNDVIVSLQNELARLQNELTRVRSQVTSTVAPATTTYYTQPAAVPQATIPQLGAQVQPTAPQYNYTPIANNIGQYTAPAAQATNIYYNQTAPAVAPAAPTYGIGRSQYDLSLPNPGLTAPQPVAPANYGYTTQQAAPVAPQYGTYGITAPTAQPQYTAPQYGVNQYTDILGEQSRQARYDFVNTYMTAQNGVMNPAPQAQNVSPLDMSYYGGGNQSNMVAPVAYTPTAPAAAPVPQFQPYGTNSYTTASNGAQYTTDYMSAIKSTTI